MVKRGRRTKVVIFLGLLILLIIPLASAGFFSDFKAKITGELTTGTSELNITIGNTAPTVSFVAAISAITPNENGVVFTEFVINATDTDGVNNLDDNSVEARFQLTGATTRVNTSCILLVDHPTDLNTANYSCTVGFYYFDNASSSWTVNVTVLDINSARGDNTSTNVQFNELKAMVISPSALSWTEFGVTSTNQGSNNDPILLNNTGNAIDLSINVTGLNLQGETTITQYIYAANLTVENVNPGCSGTQMSNETSINVTSIILQKGNNSLSNNDATSGQEEAFFCVTAVNSDISAQSYSSAAYGAWTITII